MKKREVYAVLKARRDTQRFIVILLVILVIIAVVATLHREQNILTLENSQRQVVHKNIRVSLTNVHKGINPVFIWSEKDGVKYHTCTGGISIDKSTHKEYILTCGHAFWNITGSKKAQRYYYQIIQPYDPTLHPITAVQEIDLGTTNKPSKDFLMCIPGPSTLILPIDNAEEHDGSHIDTLKFSKQDKSIAYSTVTGETVECVGVVKLNGTILSVLDYSPIESESGTLFVTPDEQIYILSRAITINDEIAKIFGIPLDHKNVCLCSMLHLK